MSDPTVLRDAEALARRDAERDDWHDTPRTHPRPVWSHATADDWDDLSWEDYR